MQRDVSLFRMLLLYLDKQYLFLMDGWASPFFFNYLPAWAHLGFFPVAPWHPRCLPLLIPSSHLCFQILQLYLFSAFYVWLRTFLNIELRSAPDQGGASSAFLNTRVKHPGVHPWSESMGCRVCSRRPLRFGIPDVCWASSVSFCSLQIANAHKVRVTLPEMLPACQAAASSACQSKLALPVGFLGCWVFFFWHRLFNTSVTFVMEDQIFAL